MTFKIESKIEVLEKSRKDTDAENIKRDIEIYELKAKVAKLRCNIDELKKESESKKNHKFQTRLWYDEKLEIVIPKRIQKIKEFFTEEQLARASKSIKSSVNWTEYDKWVKAGKPFVEHDKLMFIDQKRKNGSYRKPTGKFIDLYSLYRNLEFLNNTELI
ncbi:hypothetical protein RhiirC2_795816 [Rhizophagus irregularis]|uniref:Uncharacterized protein n=1 Tax=Rhizophagus irregularis TaxID=588596 RepID=A0A2N1MAW0_9GLOM|nr:hypothetical protein RhiirC2_795816 [Rhizophagus irregularis]